ncbi:hypothetical protein LAZ67_4003493 [Cordylochernes scorpioides]|uniref:Reverse transcriptase Ty1/copia-type domain-containing protein n=1 Tax=Cordylochernes scorpioides TaxID=51811 RepID=A0ABY6KDP5_9ARAC|nr:hypothetical protein LAZ67_4003493 [Cordylochernes scorpioides]
MNTPFSDQWKEALEEEFHSITSHNVWTLVPKPENENLIKGKWIFNIKMNPDGSIDKRKARFVAMGHNQKLGVDYEESFAPVMKLDSLRTLIAIASQQNMKIEQYDVKTAYLNAELKDDVYLEQPEGFVQAGQENKTIGVTMIMSSYNFRIERKKSGDHGNPDGLSRLPLEEYEELEENDELNSVHLIQQCEELLLTSRHIRFKAGRISIEDDPRQGRPKFQRTDENVQKITDLIKENPRTTLLELEQDTGISKTAIGRIVTEDLKLKKTPAKFIPRFLTNEQKLCRLATCEDMMEMTRTDPEWKDKIITGDETWVYGYDPETKPQSAEWRG